MKRTAPAVALYRFSCAVSAAATTDSTPDRTVRAEEAGTTVSSCRTGRATDAPR
jgi:hypothetical protein